MFGNWVKFDSSQEHLALPSMLLRNKTEMINKSLHIESI